MSTSARMCVVATLMAVLAIGLSSAARSHAVSCRPVIAHVEVTQAVQDDLNTIPLVDRRPTTVRVYLRLPDQSCSPLTGVSGKLRARLNSGSGGIAYGGSGGIWPTNHKTIEVNRYEWDPNDRSDFARSLDYDITPNIWFMTGDGYGSLRFEFCTRVAEDGNTPCDSWASGANPDFTFRATCAPYMTSYNIDYRGRGIAPAADTAPDSGPIMIPAIYPVSVAGPGAYRYVAPRLTIAYDADISYYHNDPIMDRPIIDLLTKIYLMSRGTVIKRPDAVFLNPSFTYGWLKGNPLLNYLGASEPYTQKVGYGISSPDNLVDPKQARYVIAHEYAHTERNTNVHPDLTIADVGWDVPGISEEFIRGGPYQGSLNRLRHAIEPDILDLDGSTTANSWMNKYKYLAAYNRWTCPTDTSQQSVMMITGIIGPGGSSSLDPVLTLTRFLGPVVPNSEGGAEVRLYDADSQLLYASHFEYGGIGPASLLQPGSDFGAFAVDIPAVTGGQRIEIYSEGVLTLTQTRSPASPQVTIANPLPGATLDSNTVISWQATDSDGDPMQSMVQYSHNGGESWTALAAQSTSTTLVFPADALASTGNGVIRVLVTDGMNTSMASVGGLQLSPNRPPVPTIYEPRGNWVYSAGANVMFIGTATDDEDGDVPDDWLTWFSSRDGYLGSGSLLNESELTVGDHIITLRAVDSLLAQTVKTVQVSVVP